MINGHAQIKWLECSRTIRILNKIDPMMINSIEPNDLQLKIMASQYIKKGGKKLRPSLLLLSASQGVFEEDSLVKACAGLELLHIASLYHDDVMDEALVRRNTPSANHQWGNDMAIQTGTYLFAEAICLLASVDSYCNFLTSKYAVDLCAGQLNEAENAFNINLTEAEYFQIIKGKTASLFELPCKLGAHLGKIPKADASTLSTYGTNLGIAFQIMDDVLDLKGQTKNTGKEIGIDIKMGVYNLPIIYAMQDEKNGDEIKENLLKCSVKDIEIKKVMKLILQTKALERAFQTALDYCQKAKEALGKMSESPAKKSFENLLDFSVLRTS